VSVIKAHQDFSFLKKDRLTIVDHCRHLPLLSRATNCLDIGTKRSSHNLDEFMPPFIDFPSKCARASSLLAFNLPPPLLVFVQAGTMLKQDFFSSFNSFPLPPSLPPSLLFPLLWPEARSQEGDCLSTEHQGVIPHDVHDVGALGREEGREGGREGGRKGGWKKRRKERRFRSKIVVHARMRHR